MPPAALSAALDRLELTQSGAARRWRINLRTLQRWLSGEVPIPEWATHLIAAEQRIAELEAELAAIHAAAMAV